MIGKTLANYEIVGQLGKGGMGVVYRARDTKLGREVALKLLPESLAGDPDRQARFHREAQAIAALKHPNIVTLYTAEEADGVSFITMELVEGKRLSDIIPSGGMELGQSLALAIPLADAMNSAHAKGITHRDLKPTNIMLDEEGRPKVLDFGLAKLVHAEEAINQTQLQTGPMTVEGAVLGTLPYASPEQVAGKPVDHRSDVFSFGSILYEMSTGERPFKGDTSAELISAVMRDEPSALMETRGGLAGQFDRIIRHCLEKDPQRRFQTSLDVKNELESLNEEVRRSQDNLRTQVIAKENARSGSARWMWPVGVIVVAMLVLLWWRGTRQSDPPDLSAVSQSDPAALAAPALRQLTFGITVEEWPGWAPDGGRLVYSKEGDQFKKLWVQELAGEQATQLTDGFGDDIQAVWSPAGDAIAFVRANDEAGKISTSDLFGWYFVGGDIWRLDLASGEAEIVVRDAFNPAFSADGSQLAFDADWGGPHRIWVADPRGRNPKQVSADDSEAVVHVSPSWSPDGSKIAYRRIENTKTDIHVLEVATQASHALTDDRMRDLRPVWSPTGNYIYFSSYRGGGQNVWRFPVDASGRAVGPAEQMTAGAGHDVQLSVSRDGTRMLFTVLGINSDLWRLPVNPVDGQSAGDPEAMIATTREDSRARWSPDGTQIAFNSDRRGGMNLWLQDVESGVERQLTRDGAGDFQPTWSADGKKLVFFSSRGGSADIWSINSDGTELVRLTDESSLDINPFFSPDGSTIAFHSDRDGRLEVWLIDADGANPRPVARVHASGHYMQWSAEGERLGIASDTNEGRKMYWVSIDDGELEPMHPINSGAHWSYNPDRSFIMDVRGHRELWSHPTDGSTPSLIFVFDDPDVRIDYPYWSPDGGWIIFDRAAPQGGDVWVLEGLEN